MILVKFCLLSPDTTYQVFVPGTVVAVPGTVKLASTVFLFKYLYKYLVLVMKCTYRTWYIATCTALVQIPLKSKIPLLCEFLNIQHTSTVQRQASLFTERDVFENVNGEYSTSTVQYKYLVPVRTVHSLAW